VIDDWRTWIGLPHEFGADPRDGKAADCLVMAWRVLDAAQAPHPPLNPAWLERARQGRAADLIQVWRDATVRVDPPTEYAIAIFGTAYGALGVGILVEAGCLTVHHRRGVCWVPLWLMRPVEWRTFH